MCVRTRISDGRSFLGLRFLDRVGDIFGVVSVGNRPRVPAIGFKTPRDVFGEIDVGGAGERDVILIVEINQLAQLQMPGERRGFLRDAFHQIAIAAKGVGVMIDDLVPGPVVARREPRFRNRQADAVGETLAQRSGGYFHAGRVPRSGWPGVLLPHLPEALEFVERKIVAGEMQQAV